MLLTLTRDVFGSEYTLSRLDVTYDGPFAYAAGGWRRRNPRGPLPFAFCCEDQDRGLDASMPLDEIARRKVMAETAIPTGRYRVRRTWSPKYGRQMMLVCDVPGYDGVRIHQGNRESHTAGCLLPGLDRNEAAGTVSDSGKACDWLDARVTECEARGEEVWVEIGRDEVAWAASRKAA
jgi:hypothetical protein